MMGALALKSEIIRRRHDAAAQMVVPEPVRDHAREHIAAVHRSLAAGGEYLCASADPGRLRAWLLEAGFRVACYVGALRMPWALAARFPAKVVRLSAKRS